MNNPNEITEDQLRTAMRTLRDNGYETVKHYGYYNPTFDGDDFQKYLDKKVGTKVGEKAGK